MQQYDVIIVGGGFSGCAAAMAAARENVKVLLIEQGGALGGAASNSLVMPYMPYSTKIVNPDGTYTMKPLVRGLFTVINEKLAEMGKYEYTSNLVYFDNEYLKVVLDRLMREYGVDVLFHATVYETESSGRRLNSVSVSSCARTMKFEASCFVDATGDANLAAMSNCSFRLGRPEDQLCQPMTLCFRICNVDWDAYKKQSGDIKKLYDRYREIGKIKNPRQNVLVFKPFPDNTMHFNSTRVVKLNPTDPFELTRAEVEAREQMLELFDFLKENFSAFEKSDIISCGSSIGIRESRMVLGEYTLTVDDIKSGRKFSDSIAAGNYDIDIHNPEGTGTSHYYFPAGVYYTIPYGSIVAKDYDNLLIAGRCISCDHEAQASIRIMPICCATGEAAGVAAAFASLYEKKAKDLEVDMIQKTLLKNGAFIKD